VGDLVEQYVYDEKVGCFCIDKSGNTTAVQSKVIATVDGPGLECRSYRLVHAAIAARHRNQKGSVSVRWCNRLCLDATALYGFNLCYATLLKTQNPSVTVNFCQLRHLRSLEAGWESQIARSVPVVPV
jgi:hypothetical protein